MLFLAKISHRISFYVSTGYYMIAICTFKTKIGYKKILTLIGSNKLISAKTYDPGLSFLLFCTDWIRQFHVTTYMVYTLQRYTNFESTLIQINYELKFLSWNQFMLNSTQANVQQNSRILLVPMHFRDNNDACISTGTEYVIF